MLFRPAHSRRSRNETAYALSPVSGPADPTGQPVHYLTGQRAACGVRSVWMRLVTQHPERTTCPACLDAMNSPVPQPLPHGSPAGDGGLSADRAFAWANKRAAYVYGAMHDLLWLVSYPVRFTPGGDFFEAVHGK